MSYIGGAGALVLETQSTTGSWFNGFASTSDPVLGTVIGLSDDLVPTADAAFDIGTNLKRVKTLHVTKINDGAAGETLEIGNYTADTGVTGIYGQLQGKNGVWKLYNNGGHARLQSDVGNLELASTWSIRILNRPVTQGDWPILLNNAGATGYVSLGPPIGGAGAFVSSSAGLSLLAASDIYSSCVGKSLNTTNNTSITAGTTMYLRAEQTLNLTAGATYGVHLRCDNGTWIENNAASESFVILPTNTGTTLSLGGTGNTVLTIPAPTFTVTASTAVNHTSPLINLGNTTTATVNVNNGSASASTTTTNIGCSVAASTNTINVGRIAANDIVNITGTVVKSPEIVSVTLASNYTFASSGTSNAPSLTTSISTSRYMSWDNTNHYFTNTHATATLTVLVASQINWNADTSGKEYYIAVTDGNYGYISWISGDLTSLNSVAVMRVAPGGTVKPQFVNAGINNVLRAGSNIVLTVI
jgi:hypothetical protein